jgi:hypothetical protein
MIAEIILIDDSGMMYAGVIGASMMIAEMMFAGLTIQE